MICMHSGMHNMATLFNNHPYISSSACIEPSLHGLDFFLEIYYNHDATEVQQYFHLHASTETHW